MSKYIVLAAVLAAGALWPVTASAQSSAPTPPCRDPWVSQAVKEVKGRTALGNGEAGECNIQLYGARWGSYPELVGYVRAAFAALDKAKLSFAGTNGQLIEDGQFWGARYVSAGIYVGPRGTMPTPAKAWVIDLPGGNVLAMDRKCRPGYTSTGPGFQGGCVKGPVPGPS